MDIVAISKLGRFEIIIKCVVLGFTL